MSRFMSMLSHSGTKTARLLGGLRESFSHVDVRNGLKETTFEVGDLVRAPKGPNKSIGRVVWADKNNVHVKYDSEGRTVNYAPNSLEHIKMEVREGSGNTVVNSEEYLKKLLPGIQKLYKSSYVRNGWEIVVPGRDLHHEDDVGVSIEFWDDEVYIVINHAKLPADGVVAAKMKLPKVRHTGSKYGPLEGLTDANWVSLGEKTAKFIEGKDLFIREFIQHKRSGSFFHQLRESADAVKKWVPENPDDYKADDLFVRADEYEDLMQDFYQAQQELHEEEHDKAYIAKCVFSTLYTWATEPQKDPLSKQQLQKMYDHSKKEFEKYKVTGWEDEAKKALEAINKMTVREAASQADRDLFKKGFLAVLPTAVRDEEGDYLLDEDEYNFGLYPAEVTIWKNDEEVGSVEHSGDFVEAGRKAAEFVKGNLGELTEGKKLKEGSGNVWVHGEDFYGPFLEGVKKVFPKARVNKYKEVVIPVKKEEDDAGLHLEAWSDYVYVVADCANPAINSETIAKKSLPESEFDPKDDLYFLRPLKKEDWVALGEMAAKVLKAKYSINESVKGSGKRALRESWQDAKILTPEEAVAELADGLKSLDYDATASGRDILLKFEDLELRLHCAFQTRDCLFRDLEPKQASSLVVYWDPENGLDPIAKGFIVGWFDWVTAVKGAYVINGQKLAIHLGRDGGAANIREDIRATSDLAKEAIQNGETSMVNGETFLI